MAHLNPQEAHEYFQGRVIEALKSGFPITGKYYDLHLENVQAKDNLGVDDIHEQHRARVAGETWSVPVHGTVVIKDKNGKTLSSSNMKLVDVPKMTARHSYIVGGQEYQLDNQWQLKPGVYVRRDRKDNIEAQINAIGRGGGFGINFDTTSKVFNLEYNKANIPIYPIMKALGANDAYLESIWGKDVFEANAKAKNVSNSLARFYKTTTNKEPASVEEAAQHVRTFLGNLKVRPEVTKITLGKEFSGINGDLLQSATEKMLKVQAGHPEDDRDSLVFKDLRSGGDYAHDQLVSALRTIKTKVQRKLNSMQQPDVYGSFHHDYFNKPIKGIFESSVGRLASQINPVEMLSSSFQTTILGPGGISSVERINDEAKLINPSHFGLLDPIVTPEGDKTGITLRLPMGVKKEGRTPVVRMYNLKTGVTELVPPEKLLNSKVVYPDQIKWEQSGGKMVPKAITAEVKMMGEGNKLVVGNMKDADYAMLHPSQLFNPVTNLVPFIGNVAANRVAMAARHMEQSVSLLHRKAPLVQVSTGANVEGAKTFEELIGGKSAHKSPVSGTVHSVSDTDIIVKDDKGKHHSIQLYKNFPLNDAKSMLTSIPIVKKGDSIKAGQVVADTNFTDKGEIALGTQLNVAYMPYRGLNFEDGLVISERARDLLTSVHLHKPSITLDQKMDTNPKHFITRLPLAFKKDQLKNIGDDGVIRVGSVVKPGDPLVLASKPFELKDRIGLAAIQKSMSATHNDRSLRWESEFDGKVVDVHKNNDGTISVHVATNEHMTVGDKLSNRYGGKGIVVSILPNDKMPRTKDGRIADVLFNPTGVGGRQNLGQIYETAIGKVVEKTGKKYIVDNFAHGVDFREKLEKELKAHGVKDKEEMIDPETGKSLGEVLIGPQHMLKLVHQIEKKTAVRSGMSLPGLPSAEGYNSNLQPSGGGHHGGQSPGALGIYALLAHGAVHNIREMQTWKSEGIDPETNPEKRWKDGQHARVWAAIQTGSPLPTPTPTFAFKKFTDMLKGAGVNIEKKGHDLILSPLTDTQILRMAGGSAGELKKPHLGVTERKIEGLHEPTPEHGGIFDPRVTGGLGGNKWSYIKLAEPVPNPLFEDPIRYITGLKTDVFRDLVEGKKAVVPGTKNFVDVGTAGSITGGPAIKSILEKIDVDAELRSASAALKTAPSSGVDALMKKVKHLRALKDMGMKPAEAYVLSYMPVMPPSVRPLSVLPTTGDIKFDDINGLYKTFGTINSKLEQSIKAGQTTDKMKSALRADVYDGMKAIMGYGVPYGDAKYKGILHIIAGSSPKEGFFQKGLVQRKQDLSMRTTIIPEPSLGLDEVGLPKKSALKLFTPFVVRELHRTGAAKDVADAQKLIAKTIQGEDNKSVWSALDRAMESRPVLLKRDPALHKYSFQAFKPKAVEGAAIRIHPLVTGGFNADFDGDSMSAFVPVSPEAVQEAHKLMPSNNLFMESSGKIAYVPTLESQLGLYKMTLRGKDTKHHFSKPEDAIHALEKGSVDITDVVHIDGKPSTPGRALLSHVLPDNMKTSMLHSIDTPLDKKGLTALLTSLGKHDSRSFGGVVNQIKDFGNHMATGIIRSPITGNPFSVKAHSLGLEDLKADKETRAKVVSDTEAKLKVQLSNPNLTPIQREKITVDAWASATPMLDKMHAAKESSKDSNLFVMRQAGIKPDATQYRQIMIAPMLYRDSKGNVVPTPVLRSFSEGLDMPGYWTSLYGARSGAVQKVQEVQEPGYMTKLLQNTAMNQVVDKHDCGTKHGISMGVFDHDVQDRVLVHAHGDYPAGTIITQSVLDNIRSKDKNAKLVVRSPLKCESNQGICQKCAGLSSHGNFYDIGTNIGILSAHAVGERAVQLTLKSFHTGGAATGGSKTLSAFGKFQQLMNLNDEIPDQATIAMRDGKVEKIEKDATGVKVYINGHAHHISKDRHGFSLHEPVSHLVGTTGYEHWKAPKVGEYFKAGEPLSDPNRTTVNPHDLYKATKNLDIVQNHLTREVFDLYKDEGIRRRNVEVLVKAMGGATEIKHPGDHDFALRGDIVSLNKVREWNKELESKGLQPISHEPVLKGVNVLPFHLHEDWMAKLQHQHLRDTIAEAAAKGGVAHIHGTHPIPGVAYGAEFGLNMRDSGKPGMTHLHDVPGHHY